jgi:glycosyltransferase involved in cell wall biosynthesis
MAVRRLFAKRKRKLYQSTWPINESAKAQPVGWQGWPEANNFAFIITHDVEGPDGLAKCRQLAELEMELGFRSSFNFIPEGDYRVPAELRDWLIQNGFEIGIHDLNHDGKLFDSPETFRRKARQINHYARDWKAVGFRAGFMLRNLDWYHHLDVQYDASTFDTDPFEPQPDGAGTIFPYWIPLPDVGSTVGETVRAKSETAGLTDHSPPVTRHNSGYVELPYTLPQDSTLFLVLQETTPDIWIRKLDWVAKHGGMALVNVHPDYLCFEGEPASARTFPIAHYRRLLEHVRERHDGSYWHVLPREIAAFTSSLTTKPERYRPKRVCMITHSIYSSDTRVMRYAESLAARGDHVDVIGLRRSADMAKEGTLNGVNIFRLQDRFEKPQSGIFSYVWPLLRFFAVSTWWLTRSHARRPYDLVHIHNIPDFLVYAAWYPKLTRTPVILDVHDIVPEFFASKFGKSRNGMGFNLLLVMERISAAVADHVIIANHLWLKPYSERTRTEGRCTPMINNVDTDVFVPRPKESNPGKLVVIFPGGLQWHQGVDIAIRAFAQVIPVLPNAEFHIYGDGNERAKLIALARSLGLETQVRFFPTTTIREISTIMAQADLGVVPKRADSFGNEAYSTKIMEFLAVGVPVVVSSTKIDRYYFNDSVVRFFPSGDADALARGMIDMLRDQIARQKMISQGLDYAAANSWNTMKSVYLRLMDSLHYRAKSQFHAP